MNYYIHNNTNGYEEPSKINFREMILYSLKSYGIFQHLRDTNFNSLDQNKVEDWLWDESRLDKEIEELEIKIKNKKKEIEDVNELDIQVAYQNEVDRLNWYNDPRSNYSASKVTKVKTCIDTLEPQISTFFKYCDIKWINEVLADIMTTVRTDLNNYVIDAEKEAKKKIERPYSIPIYQEYKKEYIKNMEGWVKSFEHDLQSKIEAKQRMIKLNGDIRRLFEYIEKTEKEIEKV